MSKNIETITYTTRMIPDHREDMTIEQANLVYAEAELLHKSRCYEGCGSLTSRLEWDSGWQDSWIDLAILELNAAYRAQEGVWREW